MSELFAYQFVCRHRGSRAFATSLGEQALFQSMKEDTDAALKWLRETE
jgi:hypothetical protein